MVSHILQMRERLQHTTALVHENIGMAQRQQKEWYDRTARERTLDPGDQFMVLLPTLTSKLLVQWQGTYKVLRRMGLVNYLIEMTGRRKRQNVFHINMLKRWNTPLSSGYLVAETAEVEGELESWTWDGGKDGEPTMGAQLTEQQRRELKELLQRHRQTLTKTPGCTNITEHSIETGDSAPIRLPPYCLPHAYCKLYSRSWQR